MRSHLSTPPSAAKGPPARPVLARRDHAGALRQPPVCRHAPKTFLPNLSQTLVNSRPSLVRALIPVQPLHPPQKSLQRDLCPARDARGLRQPPRQPCCAQNFLPNLTQSLVISRVTLLHLACLSTPSTAAKMLLTSIPFETGTLPANATTVSWPSRLPLPEIRNSAPNLLLPPCKSLHHRISCTHRRKSKATANHLCTFTNVCRLTEQPQLQDHNAAAPDATRCAHPQTFFKREQGNT